MGVSRILVIGRKKLSTHGNQMTNRFMEFVFFDHLRECCAQLRKEGFTILGVEIGPTARSVVEHPFTGPTAFLFGNEGRGLDESHVKLCDGLVYIPQYGVGTASLNVVVAAGIVLHRFAVWAGYSEAPREGVKFLVDESKAVRSTNRVVPESGPRERRREGKQEMDPIEAVIDGIALLAAVADTEGGTEAANASSEAHGDSADEAPFG